MLTEVYVKMCWKARDDLKKHWDPKGGDRVLSKMYNHMDKIQLVHLPDDLTGKDGSVLLHKETDIWIPRQEDLQSLILKIHPCYENLQKITREFFSWYQLEVTFGDYEEYPLNELWLLFTMEHFDKHWNGAQWEGII